MSIRDLRDRSRRALHDAMQVPAVYIPKDRSSATACNVRLHNRTDRFGGMAGFDYAPAERVSTVPKIVFLAEQITPSRNGVVVLASDEVYVLDNVLPRDGITITAEATPMDASQIAEEPVAFPLPGSDLTTWPGA